MAFKVGRNGVQMHLPEVMTSSVYELLVELLEMGALVSFGTSRDRAAIKVTVTVAGEWDFEWCRTEDELVDWMKEAVAAVGALDIPPPTKSRRRKGLSEAS